MEQPSDNPFKVVYLILGGEQQGPFEEEQLRSMWNSGAITSWEDVIGVAFVAFDFHIRDIVLKNPPVYNRAAPVARLRNNTYLNYANTHQQKREAARAV